MSYYSGASHSVEELLKPVYDVTPINYFSYCSLDSTRRASLLISNESIFKEYINENYLMTDLSSYHLQDIQPGYHLLNDFSVKPDECQINLRLAEHYKIGNFLVVSSRQDDTCELFTFGTDVSFSGDKNFYLQQRDFLKNIIQVLTPSLREMVKSKELPMFDIPYCKNDGLYDLPLSKCYGFSDIEFLAKLRQQGLQLRYGRPSAELNHREVECLKQILINNTAKKAARVVGLSHRTVEHHFAAIKAKLGCRNKADVFDLFSSVIAP